MINSRLNTIIFCLVVSTTYGISQQEAEMPSEPGKCFAKCLIQDTYKTESTSLYLKAIGDQPMHNTVREKVETRPASRI